MTEEVYLMLFQNNWPHPLQVHIFLFSEGYVFHLGSLFSSSDERHPRPGKRQREDDDEEAEEDLNESNFDEVTPSLYDM